MQQIPVWVIVVGGAVGGTVGGAVGGRGRVGDIAGGHLLDLGGVRCGHVLHCTALSPAGGDLGGGRCVDGLGRVGEVQVIAVGLGGRLGAGAQLEGDAGMQFRSLPSRKTAQGLVLTELIFFPAAPLDGDRVGPDGVAVVTRYEVHYVGA